MVLYFLSMCHSLSNKREMLVPLVSLHKSYFHFSCPSLKPLFFSVPKCSMKFGHKRDGSGDSVTDRCEK